MVKFLLIPCVVMATMAIATSLSNVATISDNQFRHLGRSVAVSDTALKSSLDLRASKEVIFAVLTQSTAIAGAACALGNPYVCAGGVAYACIVGFFALFATRNDKREVDTAFFAHTDYVASAGCNTACQIATKTQERVWTFIGSGFVDGVLHDYHHFRDGHVNGIRAYQGGYAAALKRSDEHNDGGFVGDYYWDNTNKAAYNSFHSTDSEEHSIATDAANFIQSNKAIELCLDFEDGDGIMNEGVFAIGWNNKPFHYSGTSAIDARLDKCQYGQILHDGETEQEVGIPA